MNCPHCNQSIEAGARYCGNCGQPLASGTAPQATQPSYAYTQPDAHKRSTKAVLSFIFGLLGIVGALLMAFISLALGVIGLVLGTMARQSPSKKLSTAGIILSSFSITVGLAVVAYASTHGPNQARYGSHAAQAPSTSGVTAADYETPCYSLNFIDRLTVENKSDSCDLKAYDGPTLNESSEMYKIYANSAPGLAESTFTQTAKHALETDVQTNLKSYSIDSETAGTFAGSPAYFIVSSNHKKNFSVIEAAVLHQTSSGKNIFVLVHVVRGGTANVQSLEAQWQWR